MDGLIGMNFEFVFLGWPVRVSLRMTPQLAPSEVRMGRLLFQLFLLGISMITCVHLLVWIVGWKVLDF